ncbi:hypothetical protein [Streptomyces griseoluteus]
MSDRQTTEHVGLAASLEAAFAKAQTEREAREAAQLAVDSVPTDNVTVLRERAKRHAYEAVDQYWGHFDDIQNMIDQRVITPLLETVSRIAAERDQAQADLAEYEPLNPQQCPAGKHADWLVDSEHTHACPWCRIAELERPAIEAKRNEIRSSFGSTIAQAQEDRDHEGAFALECQLREREEQWKREDEEATR